MTRASAAESDSSDRSRPIPLDVARQRADRLARLRAGEQAALGELVAEYWDRIVRYSARLLGDLDAAHDAAQATFVRVWLKRAEIPSGLSIGAFIYRTARSYAIDEYRRLAARRRGLALWENETGEPRTPLEQAERAELNEAIDQALARLSPRRREVFVLFHFHNLSYNQIAEIMGVRPQVVANYMSAALADLRSSLASSIEAYLDHP